MKCPKCEGFMEQISTFAEGYVITMLSCKNCGTCKHPGHVPPQLRESGDELRNTSKNKGANHYMVKNAQPVDDVIALRAELNGMMTKNKLSYMRLSEIVGISNSLLWAFMKKPETRTTKITYEKIKKGMENETNRV